MRKEFRDLRVLGIAHKVGPLFRCLIGQSADKPCGQKLRYLQGA